jgi:hypothetical protein
MTEVLIYILLVALAALVLLWVWIISGRDV